jgi:hypothetical protein
MNRCWYFAVSSLLIAVTACNIGISTYEPDSVVVDKPIVDTNGNLSFSYGVTLETLYASPGLLVRMDGSDIRVSVVRCWIDRDCNVDVASDVVGRRYAVRIPGNNRTCAIVLEGRNSLRRIPVENAKCKDQH